MGARRVSSVKLWRNRSNPVSDGRHYPKVVGVDTITEIIVVRRTGSHGRVGKHADRMRGVPPAVRFYLARKSLVIEGFWSEGFLQGLQVPP